MRKDKPRSNRLFIALLSTMLLGSFASLKGINAVPVKAATTEPAILGEGLNWDINDPANKMTPVVGLDDVFEKSFTGLTSNHYTIVAFGSAWVRYPNTGYDRANSNAGNLIYPIPDGDKNILLQQTGDVTFRIYNPDNEPGSPAGPYRYTVNYTTLPNPAPNTKTNIVLGGSAVGGWRTDIEANRLEWMNARYALKGMAFTAGEFKPYVWKTWDGGWNCFSIDTLNSTAADVLSNGSAPDYNIIVNTAGNYGILYDLKTQMFTFHAQTTTTKTVSKYYGTTKLEEEFAFSGIAYNPTECEVAGKKLVGWYTDADFENLYIPGEVNENINLYGKFVEEIKLAFYDKAQTISTGDVYAYGWNNDATVTLGAWPGTKMTKHGYGYHTLDVAAANICDNLVFNNGLGGDDEVKTGDLTWNLPFNIYHNINNAWGTNSDDYHAATLFGIRILHETRLCDATGATNKVVLNDWNTLAGEFNALSVNVKALIKNHVGSVTGDLLDQAVVRYDYIVAKYGGAGYNDFINRAGSPSPLAPRDFMKHENLLIIYAVLTIAIITGAAIALLKRQKKAQK
ncbi:MAG: starch-binding protein [Bacilli bacterium]